MPGLLTGLLASALGGGGDDNTSFGDRMAMNFAPQMYAAMQQKQQQKATEDALSGMGGQMPPGMAHGMAVNPQLMQQAGAAYLPSAPEMKVIPGPGGTSSLLQSKVGPGGNIQANPINVGASAGATASPQQAGAAAGATASPQQAGAALPGQGSQAGRPQPPPTRPGVIPGSAGDMQDKILWGRQNGLSKDELLQFVPTALQDEVKGVLDGTQSVKDLSTRGVGEGDRTNILHLAHQINPNWDEDRSEALNKYRTS